MIFLRSTFFNLGLYLWTLILFFPFLGVLFLPRRFAHAFATTWSRGILFLLRVCVGVRCHLTGQEYIGAGNLYALKHQSAWETAIFFAFVPRSVFVLKDTLLLIPLIGIALKKMGHIAINRQASRQAMQKVKMRIGSMTRLKESVAICPEGTRMPVGQTGVYHSGVYAIQQMMQTAIVPIAVNSGLYWPKNKWCKTPGTITLAFLPPIPFDETATKQSVMTTLKTRIEEQVAILCNR